MAVYVLKVKKDFRGVEEGRKISVGETIEITSKERLKKILGFNLADLVETRVEEDPSIKKMSYSELQEEAKKLDIPANKKKKKLIKLIEEAKNA